MAITAQRLSVEVDADTSKAKKELGDLQGEGKKVPAWMGAAKAAVVGFGIAGAVAFGGKIIGSASDLNETLSKTGVVFGPQSDQVVGYAQEMADSFGLPKTAILDAASGFGLLGKAAGLSGAPLTGMSTDLSTLAADAASFYNVPLEQALGDFGSALSGESEPVKKYGVLMNEAAVTAEAVALGVANVGDELTEGQKVQARASLLMKGMSDASGDLARTQDSVSNRMRELKGRVGNLAADMGQKLLPAAQVVLGALIGLVDGIPKVVASMREWLAENGWAVDALKAAAVAVGVFVAGMAAVSIVKTVTTWIKAARLAMLGLNAALLANPVGLVVAAIALLAAGVYLAYTRFTPFRNLVDGVVASLKAMAARVMEAFSAWGGTERVMGIVSAGMGVARSAIGWVVGAVQGLIAAWHRISPVVTGAIGTVTGAIGQFSGWVSGLWAQLWGKFGPIVKTNLGIVLTVAKGILGVVVAGIRTGLNSAKIVFVTVLGVIKQVWSVAWTVIRTVVVTAWNVIKSLIKGAIGVVKGIIETGVNLMTGNWRGAWQSFKSIFSSAWGGIRGAISAAISGMVSLVRTVPGKIKSALGNIGNLLVRAGGDLIRGLARGIRNAVGSATSAISGVMSRIRGFLPGSPIKTGPLKDWNRGGAGKRLGALVASGLRASSSDVRAAALQMARAASVEPQVGRVRVGAAQERASARRGFLAPTAPPSRALLAGARGGSGASVAITIHNPIAEPTSKTVNRGLQRLGALNLG